MRQLLMVLMLVLSIEMSQGRTPPEVYVSEDYEYCRLMETLRPKLYQLLNEDQRLVSVLMLQVFQAESSFDLLINTTTLFVAYAKMQQDAQYLTIVEENLQVCWANESH